MHIVHYMCQYSRHNHGWIGNWKDSYHRVDKTLNSCIGIWDPDILSMAMIVSSYNNTLPFATNVVLNASLLLSEIFVSNLRMPSRST